MTERRRGVSVRQTDTGWAVIKDGEVVADGLSNARAWQLADQYSSVDQGMEATRRDVSYYTGQW